MEKNHKQKRSDQSKQLQGELQEKEEGQQQTGEEASEEEVLEEEAPDEDEEVRPGQASILFERFGIWLALVMLGISIWYRFIPLIVLATFFLIIAALITLWKKTALTRVFPSVELDRRRIFAGERITLSSSLENRKWLPLVWIEWEQAKQKGIVWEKEEHETYTMRLLWLLWYQKAAWDVQATVKNRGVYRLGTMTLRSGDGFRFSEEERKEDLGVTLYAYPKLRSVSVPPFSPALQWGMGQNGGFLEDPVLISGIRDYQSGDELRKINWQATARAGKLQTTVHQPVKPRQLILYIDVRGFEASHLRQSFEWFLSIIASVAVRYHQQGMMIGYASNALDHEGKPIGFSAPSTVITSFLDQLAKITPHINERQPSLEDVFQPEQVSVPVYVFTDRLRLEYEHWLRQNDKLSAYFSFYYRRETDSSTNLALGKVSTRKMYELLSTSERKRDAG